jgi:hypothetical protein
MTPSEAFEIGIRYRLEKRMGLRPQPLRKPPVVDEAAYVPAFFLWMCFGRGIGESGFDKFLAENVSIKREMVRSTESRYLRYHVGSFLAAWQKRNSGRASKRIAAGINLATDALRERIKKKKEKQQCT